MRAASFVVGCGRRLRRVGCDLAGAQLAGVRVSDRASGAPGVRLDGLRRGHVRRHEILPIRAGGHGQQPWRRFGAPVRGVRIPVAGLLVLPGRAAGHRACGRCAGCLSQARDTTRADESLCCGHCSGCPRFLRNRGPGLASAPGVPCLARRWPAACSGCTWRIGRFPGSRPTPGIRSSTRGCCCWRVESSGWLWRAATPDSDGAACRCLPSRCS